MTSPDRRSRLLIVLAAFASIFVPPFVYALHYKALAAIYFFAGDAFYYFDITRHSLNRPNFSFDGSYPTNGFHPLWEYLLFLLEKLHILDLTQNAHPLVTIFYLNLLLLATAGASFCLFACRYLANPGTPSSP